MFDHDGTLVNTEQVERKLYPGIRELIGFLAEKQIPMFVWTMRSYASTKEILESLGVYSFFTDICGCNNAPSKPSPEGIEYLVPGVKAENVIVIGDSVGDIIGGKKFGAHTIGAGWGHGNSGAMQVYAEYGAHVSFMDVSELRTYIEKLL